MRGNRRYSQRQSLSGENASDASPRALHHSLPARSRRQMTCAQARQLLGAYRRDDWSQSELAALGQHLITCAECRQIEASYRQVGESIRQLPSMTPPPHFRASVFAAIQAEQRRLKPAVERIASEETSPSIPVVRPTPIRRVPRRKISAGMRAAMAIAAVLVLALAAIQL